jgi:hypothetical protein
MCVFAIIVCVLFCHQPYHALETTPVIHSKTQMYEFSANKITAIYVLFWLGNFPPTSTFFPARQLDLFLGAGGSSDSGVHSSGWKFGLL